MVCFSFVSIMNIQDFINCSTNLAIFHKEKLYIHKFTSKYPHIVCRSVSPVYLHDAWLYEFSALLSYWFLVRRTWYQWLLILCEQLILNQSSILFYTILFVRRLCLIICVCVNSVDVFCSTGVFVAR